MLKMPGRSLAQLELEANHALREAMMHERCKRWRQVVQSYKRLLRCLRQESFPEGYRFPQWIKTLRYECEYHLGIALQHLNQDRKAALHYTRAIEAVYVPKNGCLAGCNANSCLMTPIYSRRAFAYARAGDLKNSLKDAEKAVVLDSKNPDVFCIRALVRSTRQERKEALKDLNHALELNPNHVCALVLHGAIAEPSAVMDWSEGKEKSTKSPYHIKACRLNSDCHLYLTVQNFKHPDIMNFYDRLLYSLGVPHTISDLKIAKRPLTSTSAYSDCSSRSSTPDRAAVRRSPFRCGTPKQFSADHVTYQRRTDYANAVREHTVAFYNENDYLDIFQGRQSENKRPTSNTTKSASQGRPQSHREQNIKVFEEVNVDNAPRMYYRPWLGDKLPVAECERKKWIKPPFKV